MNIKGYIVEYEKEGRVAPVVIAVASKEQPLKTAPRKKTYSVTVIDEAEKTFAHWELKSHL